MGWNNVMCQCDSMIDIDGVMKSGMILCRFHDRAKANTPNGTPKPLLCRKAKWGRQL